jgi:thiol-disulfide isomerase/thioredoxin
MMEPLLARGQFPLDGPPRAAGVDFAVASRRSPKPMRRLLLFFPLLIFATVSDAGASTGQERAAAAGAPLIGRSAPALVIKTIDGETIDLGSVYGKKAVYLKFWATWCVPCREQMPHLERAFESAGSDLLVLAVDTGFNESRADVIAYRRTMGLKMPIAIDDGRLAAAFNLRVTPQHVVIGRDGRIAYIGHLADQRLDDALTAARRAPAAALAATAAAAAAIHYGLGSRAADLKLVAINGQGVPAADAVRHRPLAIVFLSSWCESYFGQSRPALAGACSSARTQTAALAADSGIRWVGIASGLWATREEVAEYRDKYKIAYPIVLDESGALFRAFDVTSVPVVVVLDGEARVRRRVDNVDKDLRAALAAAR